MVILVISDIAYGTKSNSVNVTLLYGAVANLVMMSCLNMCFIHHTNPNSQEIILQRMNRNHERYIIKKEAQ